MKIYREIGVLALIVGMMVAPSTAWAQSDSQVERYINLNISEGDIRDALKLVAEHGGLNLVIGPEVQGKVSLYLTNATLESALRAITLNNGFEYKVEEGIISVSKKPEQVPEKDTAPELETRVFTLRSADAERVRDALQFALSPFGKMKSFNENSQNEYSTLALSQLEGDVGGDVGGQVGINGGVGNAPGAIGNNQAQVNQGRPAQNARKLVVTDVPENMPAITDLIMALDKMPPQVLIEVRLVEISTDLQRQLGIDWDIDVLANGPVLNHEFPLHMEAGFASGSQIRRTANGTANSSVGLSLGTIDFSNFTSLLRIHQSDNSIRLLANPRLLVYNNHNASILVGERFPLLEANVSEFGVVTESLQTYIPIGIQLEVRPTIMVDGRVTMAIHPVTSSLGDNVVGTTGISVARIQTRELSTRIIMDDGQTVVLGGLINDRKTRNVQKVPGLGDLWGLSALFRQENPSSQRTDLLVFVTAKVEGGHILSARDREIFDSYEPNFKEVQRLQDVQLQFEVPSEYEDPKPQFGDSHLPVTHNKYERRQPVADEMINEPPPSDAIDVIRKDPMPATKPESANGRIAAQPMFGGENLTKPGEPLNIDEDVLRRARERRQAAQLRRMQATGRSEP